MRKNYSSVPSVKSLRILGTTRWTHDQMTTWPDDQMSKWPDDQMTIWPYDHIDQMTRWPDDQMIGWSDDQMIRWPDDHMTRKLRDHIDQMTRLPYSPDDHFNQMTRWPDDHTDKMTRRPDEQMTSWSDNHIDQMTILTKWQYWPDDQITKKRHQSPQNCPRYQIQCIAMVIYDDLTILIYKNIIENNIKPKASPEPPKLGRHLPYQIQWWYRFATRMTYILK